MNEIEPVVNEVMAVRPAFTAIAKHEEAVIVGDWLKAVKDVRAKIAEFFKPEIDAAHKLHKNLLAKMKQVDDVPAKAEADCRKMLVDWQEAERQRQAEEQRRLDAEARRAALAAARKNNDTQLHAAIKTGEIPVVSTVAAPAPEKIEGISARESWKAEVTDLMALVKAVAARTIPLDMIEPNMTTLNALMRSTKGQMTVPGVRAVRVTGITSRG